MKKKIVMSITLILIVALFAIVRVSVGKVLDTKTQTDYAQSDYYRQRMDAEWKEMQKAIKDSDVMRDNLEIDFEKTDKCAQTVKRCLIYALDHFEELEKGDNANIDIVSKLSYAYSYIYYLETYSDYDQRVYTEKERDLNHNLVSKYIDTAKLYMSDASSNTQEKADLLKAQDLARQLERNLDEEVEKFVDCLVDVIEEGSK